MTGRMLQVHDTRLHVVERGAPDALPVLALHGGPGLDHTEFGHYLDPLTDDGRYRLVLVDQRGQGRSDRSAPPQTWTLHQMASDVSAVAADLGAERYVVLGHSFGAMVALQHAVDAPGAALATVFSCGVPSERFLDGVDDRLAAFEPVELREQVTRSWQAETEVSSDAECRDLFFAQLPFHFADPTDRRIESYAAEMADMRASAALLRHYAERGYAELDLEQRLGVVPQPVLVLAGRHDRVCPVQAAAATVGNLRDAELVVFEHSAHSPYVEETSRYLAVVRDFLDRRCA